MPNKKTKSKAKTDYLAKFREMRAFSSFKFKKDLRQTRNDNHFTKSEKAAITRLWNDYEPIRENIKNGSAQIVKPRHHKGESERAYIKRVKEIRKNENPDSKHALFIVAHVPHGSKIQFDKNNRMITQRKNNVLTNYDYKFSAYDKMEFIFDPAQIIHEKIYMHNELHPKKPPLLIGLTTNGFPWKLVSIRQLNKLVEDFLIKQSEYLAQDDNVNIADFITGILIRA